MNNLINVMYVTDQLLENLRENAAEVGELIKNHSDTLWLKKCTDDKNLSKDFTFLTKDGDIFDVTEYNDGTFDIGPREKFKLKKFFIKRQP